MEIKKVQIPPFIHNYKKFKNTQRKYLNWNLKQRNHLNYYKSFIHLPFTWEALILYKNNHYSICLYSNNYSINISVPLNFSKIFFDQNTSTVIFSNIYENNFTTLYMHKLNQLLTLCNHPTYLKLKFKGKGYYIYKNFRTTITPQFGFAHRNYIYASYVNVKFRSKTSIMLFGTSYQDIISVGLRIKRLRSINIFTGRGVRFNKQVVYKKTGKVSSYR